MIVKILNLPQGNIFALAKIFIIANGQKWNKQSSGHTGGSGQVLDFYSDDPNLCPADVH